MQLTTDRTIGGSGQNLCPAMIEELKAKTPGAFRKIYITKEAYAHLQGQAFSFRTYSTDAEAPDKAPEDVEYITAHWIGNAVLCAGDDHSSLLVDFQIL